jgi:FHS family L-fucose permease-like MFS transporter
VLGAPATASSRLTLTQAFNSLGTTIGPAVGGMLILGAATVATPSGAVLTETQRAAARAAEAATVQGPYLGLAAALLILGILFALVRLPRLDQAAGEHGTKAGASVLSQRHLVLGAIGIFVYVGGEVTIGSFLINFIGERHIMGLPEAVAAHYVSYYWGGAMVGRFVGSVVMRYISPGKTLAFNALCSMILIVTAIFGQGPVAMWALLAVGLFNSIMFPTIFSMALHRLGPLTGQGSGILCMAIVGGAVLPFAQGALADSIGLQWSFALPAACYAYILFFGMKYARMYLADHP